MTEKKKTDGDETARKLNQDLVIFENEKNQKKKMSTDGDET